jgi:hypothetical protein
MSAMQTFNAGLDRLADWETATYQWMLLTAGTFDPDLATVAAVLAAGAEVTVTGYVRLAASSKARTVDNTLDQVTYTVADPSWTGLGAGETITAVVLYRTVTNDSDSIPVGQWDLSPSVATDLADPLTFTSPAGVVAYIDQGA